jgi:hypothetical protein
VEQVRPGDEEPCSSRRGHPFTPAIDSLTVTDVFGTTTAIPRADAGESGSWTVFSTSDRATGGVQPFLVAPATASTARQGNAPLEEVHLLRDETADMAWAIERIVETPVGDTVTLSPYPGAPAAADAPAALSYLLETPLPGNWFPLLPVVTKTGSLALVAGTMEGTTQTPATLILTQLSGKGLELPQHEVSRAGLVLQRVAGRTRPPGGGSTLWVARRREIGAGEA